MSVWCTKHYDDDERSFVRMEPAREASPPSTDVLLAKTTASASTVAYKEQIYAAVVDAAELPAGPVRLELSFVVGPRRNWLNLWKQTIDSLDPLLGRTYPHRAWHPRDDRITELGVHVTVDPAAGNEIVVGIAATQAMPERKIVFRTYGICVSKYEYPDGTPTGWSVVFPHWPNEMHMSTDQAKLLRDVLGDVLDERVIGRPHGVPSEVP